MGLASSDFEIFLDGRPQTTNHFSYVPASLKLSSRADRRENGANSSAIHAPADRIAPQDVHHTIVIFVDDLSLAAESIPFVRKGVRRGNRRLRDIAIRHSLTTRRVLVRGDGSTAHEGIFDTDTGEFLGQTTHQGYRGDSCWSRGLTWALYGFTTCYEYSRDPHFLETARSCADYYISHAPSDGVPPWDFNAPPENRTLLDTSSAAICAAGLLRLCRLEPDSLKGHLYWTTAVQIMRSLCEKHLAKSDPKWEGILKGGVYHVHKGLGVDESVMWGEFFFCEALERVLW